MTSDQAEHLNLLAIFHYVVGGLVAVFSLFPLMHLAMGVLLLTGSLSTDEARSIDSSVAEHEVEARPEGGEAGDQTGVGDDEMDARVGRMVGIALVGFSSVFILCGEALAVCILLAGRYLHRRTRPQFCMVVACIECILMPFGTVLGIFTIMLLVKPEVKQAFGVADSRPAVG